MEKAQLFWQTYLKLEKEFLEVAKYIYITDSITTYSKGTIVTSSCQTQLGTFSPHIADLLIRTCIEIEAISKELYFDFGGEKARGDKDLFFDEDCLKQIDIKCNTHKKIVMVSCPAFNLTKEENLCFKPLKDAHKRQGTDWERAYQAVKHDRYSSISQATVKNLLHAMGALYLLNIYYKNVKLTSKYSEIRNLDFSLGSSIFSVKRPNDNYIIDIINSIDVTGLLQADESPFVLKYTDSCYKQILAANQAVVDEEMKYLLAQPELIEPDFIQRVEKTAKIKSQDSQLRYMPFVELCKYRINKRIPPTLPFEERKKHFVSSPEWKGKMRQQNPHLSENQITESNIQAEIDQAGKFTGIELELSFENEKIYKAIYEGYCELVLDKGSVQYKKL